MKCGLRPGEIQSLRWEKVDFNALTLNILDTKKHSSFPVPMDLATADYLRELKADLREGWVIDRNPKSCGWRDRTDHLSLENLEHILKKWARLAGCETWQKMRVYDLRHFFAANWAYPSDGKKPGNLHALSKILRHSTLLSTQIYLSRLVFYEDLQAEYNRLQSWPFAQGQQGPVGVPAVGNEFFDSFCRVCTRQPTCRYMDQAMTSPWASGCKWFEKALEKEELNHNRH
jgi:integrase